MSIRLSYILPIYNVEQYLAQCLDSIFWQNLPEDEYEVICVNDCSIDGSLKILKQYQSVHPHMQILTFEQNRGPSAARNEGIRMAKGQYIWFVDSDDFIGTNVTSLLLRKAEEDDLDVLLFNYCDFEDGVGITCEPHTFSNHEILAGIQFVNEVLGDAFIYHLGYVVRFLLKREYIVQSHLSFPEGQYWEDTVYFPKAILGAQRVASVDVLGYYYRKNPSSISGGKSTTWSLKKIYDYSIKVGIEMWRYSEEIRDIDSHWSKILKRIAFERFQSFPFKLWKRIKNYK